MQQEIPKSCVWAGWLSARFTLKYTVLSVMQKHQLGQLKIERRKVDEEINHLRKQIETCGPGTTIRERYAGVRCVTGWTGRQADPHDGRCPLVALPHLSNASFCSYRVLHFELSEAGWMALVFRKLLRIYCGYSSLYQIKQT